MENKNSIYLKYNCFCSNVKVFAVSFDQFNASLLNKSINLFLKKKKKLTETNL